MGKVFWVCAALIGGTAFYATHQGDTGSGKLEHLFGGVIDKVETSAESGSPTAQTVLGAMYESGKGEPRDFAAAMEWYRKAADQGLAPAQNAVGRMYENGEGVPSDQAEALRWYRMAAHQGDEDGQKNVARLNP